MTMRRRVEVGRFLAALCVGIADLHTSAIVLVFLALGWATAQTVPS